MIAELPGVRLWFEDSGGAGPAVVLLHAGTGSCGMWRHQLAPFAAAGFRVVAYDRRHHGRTESAAPSTEEPVPSEDLRALLDALEIGAAALVGTAAGGIVATDFALSYPARVPKLVLANTAIGVEDADFVAMRTAIRPPDVLPPELRELGPTYRAANPRGTQAWLELEATGRKRGVPTWPRVRNRICYATLASLPMPALLLTGDADLYTPPPLMALVQARMTNARSVVIPAAGHSAYWEQPERFNRAVLDFLSGGGVS